MRGIGGNLLPVDFSCYLFIKLSSLRTCARNTREARISLFCSSPAGCVFFFFLISMDNLISDRMDDGQYRRNNAPTGVTRRDTKK